MNGLLYMDVSVFKDAALNEKGLTFLSTERKKQIEQLKNPAAARLSLGAGVLLFFALQRCGYENELEHIKKGRHGKPYLEGFNFQFSLSHSGSYALCAYAKQSIGADLQQIRGNLPNNIRKILSQEEENFLSKQIAEERKALFFRLWARKESLIKWDGRGLRIPLEQLSFVKDEQLLDFLEFEGKRLYFREYPNIIEGYAVCLCQEEKAFPPKAEEITPQMLKNFKNYEFSLKSFG